MAAVKQWSNLPAAAPGQGEPLAAHAEFEDLCTMIEEQTYGHTALVQTPYGTRPLVYADSTASGRSLEAIEGYLQSHVMPMYSNTHTTSSACGLQTMQLVEEARQIIKDALRATDEDAVIFAGSGSTGAIKKCAEILGLGLFATSAQGQYLCTFPGCHRRFHDEAAVTLHARTHGDGDFAARSWRKAHGETNADRIQRQTQPLVLVGPMEHHSNYCIWKESGAQVLEVPPGPDHRIDAAILAQLLAQHAPHRTVVAAFSAASNVTGLEEDVSAITRLVHQHHAIAVWDCAASAPHARVDLNPTDPASRPDAVFISPHKFPGGPDTPGLLCIKKKLLSNAVPSTPAGGTVFYVSGHQHRYMENSEEREEGGTPNILGNIRCGLVFRLQKALGVERIAAREQAMMSTIMNRLAAVPNLCVAGGDTPQRLPILSFGIRHPRDHGRFLHWNFASALLNDLFGVQARGGCLCAGPYAHRLLGISPEDAVQLENALLDKREVLRPGFVRVSFSFHWPEAKLDYVLQAIEFVARHGYLFLDDYLFYVDTGEYRHRAFRNKSPHRMWLSEAVFGSAGLSAPVPPHARVEAKSLSTPQEALAAAQQLAQERQTATNSTATDAEAILGLPEGLRRLVWFQAQVSPAASLSSRTAGQAGTGDKSLQLLADAAPLDAAAWNQSTAPLSEPTEANLDAAPEAAAALDGEDGPVLACPLVLMRGRLAPPPSALPLPAEEDEGEENDEDDGDADEPTHATMSQAGGNMAGTETADDVLFDTSALGGESDGEEEEAAPAAGPTFHRLALKPKVPKSLLRTVGEAIRDYDMIQEGDRILVGLSGGKDSLSLLHCLLALQRKAPVRFEVGAVTMNPNFPGFDPRPLIPYLKALGVPYFFESQDLLAQAQDTQPSSICSWCARMKRGILYSCLRREGYNVLALGQHLDDLAESFVMSSFHNGRLRTMKAHYCNGKGDVRIIRPLVYTRERQTRTFAAESHLPVIQDNCPACFEEPKERYRVKTLLANQEHLYPSLFRILLRSMRPLMRDHTLPACVSASKLEEINARDGELVYHGQRPTEEEEGDE